MALVMKVKLVDRGRIARFLGVNASDLPAGPYRVDNQRVDGEGVSLTVSVPGYDRDILLPISFADYNALAEVELPETEYSETWGSKNRGEQTWGTGDLHK